MLYALDIKKIQEDCNYAITKNKELKKQNLYVLNMGSKINTDMPEYVPVLTPRNELIFTSRRKDSPREKKNPNDGKYFESMYVSKLEKERPQKVRRYTLPDLYLKSNFRKFHESIISISTNGKTLFVFRDSKIFEINIDSVEKTEPTKLIKTINFDYYQNHAYLSKDEKTLLFTSDAEKGIGGIDIYKAVKTNDGLWSKPENLGKIINTVYDEDAPFLSDDGNTLYFSSKGHPGFGNYDVYKSQLVSGEWSIPENLSEPINSPANDIFLVNSSNQKTGYFSSSRKGGYGDMDIYKINYLTNIENSECNSDDNTIVNIDYKITDETLGLVSLESKSNETLNPIYYSWSINNEVQTQNQNKIEVKFPNIRIENSVKVKVISICDTCYNPVVACANLKINISKKNTVTADSTIENNNIVTNPYDKDLIYNYVSKTKIKNEFGFNLTPIHFELNKFDITSEAKLILDQNIEALAKHSEISVLVYGFSDANSSATYNLVLSLMRAKKVKTYLISKGVEPNRIIKTIGKG